MASVDVIIMGRNTFDKVVSFGKDMWAYGTTPIVVWTRNPDAVTIPDFCASLGVSCTSKEPVALCSDLTAKGYKHAYVDGGTTIRAFLKAHMVQQLILTRVPILLGNGISLFGDDDEAVPPVKLQHGETKSYPNGLVTTRYSVIPSDSDSCK